MSVYVYLVYDHESGLTKIGKSCNPTRRFEELKWQPTLLPKPHAFMLFGYFEAHENDERVLHKKFDRQRVRGEWFNLSDAEINSIYDYFACGWDERYEDFHDDLMTARYSEPTRNEGALQ